jgi:large subunit ribosomal protein L21
MRYAIIERGGKQFKAVEGRTIDVDRLSDAAGVQVDLRTLFMADGDDFMVGTPTVNGIQVKATILEHFRGEKVLRFKYSPKKRIRVRGGHRQHYSRLMVDFIGRPGETRKVEIAEPVEKPEKEPKNRADKPAKGHAQNAPKKAENKAPAKKSEKAAVTSSPKGKKPADKKSSSTKKSSK